MDLNLCGKVAVGTGGSVGIGLAVAEGLAAEGVDLVPAARDGARGHPHRCCLLRPPCAVAVKAATAAGCARVIAETETAFGGADILIDNAGSGTNETILEASDEKWQLYWDLHMMAAVRLSRGPAPR